MAILNRVPEPNLFDGLTKEKAEKYAILMITIIFGCIIFFCDTALAQNKPPEISSSFLKTMSIKENGKGELNLIDFVKDDSDQPKDIKWSVGNTINITVEIQNGKATFTPKLNWAGEEKVVLSATDSGGLSTSVTLTITVVKNNPPEILSSFSNNQEMNEDEKLKLALVDVVKDDNDSSDKLKWKTENSPNITVNITGGIATFSPTLNWNGIETVYIIAIDTAGLSTRVSLTIFVKPIDDAPTIIREKFNDIRFYEDKFYILFLGDKVKDIDDELRDITWKSVGSLHILVDIQGSYAIFKTSEANWNGDKEVIELAATDKTGLSDTIKLKVVVMPDYDWPEILKEKFPPEIIIEKDKPKIFSLDDKVKDADSKKEEITWSTKYSANINVSINGNTATFTLKGDWRNLNEWVEFKATDIEGGYDRITLPVVLSCIPPEILIDRFPKEEIVIDEDTTTEFSLLGTVKEDNDNNSSEIVWTAIDSSHVQVEINNQQAIFSSKQKDWFGEENVVLTAKNRCGLTNKITLHVIFLPINDPPEILTSKIPSEIVIKDGKEVTIYLGDKVSDPEDNAQDIRWDAKGSKNIGVVVQNNGASFTLKQQGWSGVEGVELIATDTEGLSSRYVFPVIAACTPRILYKLFPTFIKEDESVSVELSSKVADDDSKIGDIIWETQDSEHIQVITAGGRATIRSKQNNWHGIESVSFTAIDLEGLYDTAKITINFTPVSEAPTILAKKFPPLVSREGKPIRVELSDKYEDDDDTPEKVVWSSDGSPNIQVDIPNYKEAIFTTKITGWHGTEEVLLTATDSEGLHNTISIPVTFPSLPPKILTAKLQKPVVFVVGKSYTIPLSDVVQDENPETVTWEAIDSASVHADFSDSGVTFTAKVSYNGEEYVTLILRDEEGQKDAVVLPVKVVKDISVSLPKWLLAQNEIYLPETTADNMVIKWQFPPRFHVIPIGYENNILLLDLATDEWWGIEKISWVATGNYGLTASGAITVIVLPKKLRFDQNLGGSSECLVPYLIDKGVPYNIKWSAEDGGTKHIAVNISGRIASFSPRADIANWTGTERVFFKAVDETSGMTDTAYIDVTFNSTPQPPWIDNEKIKRNTPVIFEIGTQYTFPPILSGLVSDPDTPSSKITWSSNGSDHVEVIFDGYYVKFKVRDEYKGWVGNETVVLTAQDDTKPEPLKVNSDPILIQVILDDVPPPVILPYWRIWQDGMDAWDLTRYLDKEDVDRVKWDFYPKDNIIPEVTQNSLRFSKSNPNWYGSEEKRWSLSSKLGGTIFYSGIITVIAMPSTWKSGDTLKLTQKITGLNGENKLIWEWQEGCAVSFKDDAVTFITNQDSFVKLKATDTTNEKNYEVITIKIIGAGQGPAVKKAEFTADKQFSVEDGKLNPVYPQQINKSELIGAFPIPANPEVWIAYRLSSDIEVFIRIYDMAGRLIRTLNLGYKPAGLYDSKSKAAYWDGMNEAGEKVSSGIYFYNIKAGNFVATKKLVIAK